MPVEPLVLRARAGECVRIVLDNKLPANLLEQDGFNTLPMIVEDFNANDIKPSNKVGLHPQMLYFDPSRDDGANIGTNTTQTAAPGGRVTYKWYAGDVRINPNGTVTTTPIEFGATNLISSDRIEHASKGAIGALIIEPENATWVEGTTTRAQADVTAGLETYREFVLQFQNDINMRMGDNEPVREPGGDGGSRGHRPEGDQLPHRAAVVPHGPPSGDAARARPTTSLWHDVASNTKVGGDPQTPVFTVPAGTQLRFRLLQSGGHARNMVFALHGHAWDKEPYKNQSTRLGRNNFSFWEGARMGHGPTNHFDALIRFGAGGKFSIVGDYLFRDQVGMGFDHGLWGILRVEQ